MRFVGVLKAPRLDPHYRAKMDEALNQWLIRGATAWLNAVTGIVPVWSGAALSTFKHLADSIGYNLLIQPTWTGCGRNLPRRSRLSIGAGDGDGGLDIDQKRGKYFFFYSTTLRHLIFNEFNSNPHADPAVFADLIHPIPYKFQLAGQKAFESVAQFARLPWPKIIIGVRFRIS